MAKENTGVAIPQEVVLSKIHEIRGQKVMLDSDLAELYHVETRRLNEQVKRNIDRFPDDFMFELDQAEWDILKSQNATSSWGGRRKLPLVFTEQGVAMLSSVLNSQSAIAVNIQIIRVFTKMREMLFTHKDIRLQLEKLRGLTTQQGRDIRVIFGQLKRMREEEENRALLARIAKEKKEDPRPAMGFKVGKQSGKDKK